MQSTTFYTVARPPAHPRDSRGHSRTCREWPSVCACFPESIQPWGASCTSPCRYPARCPQKSSRPAIRSPGQEPTRGNARGWDIFTRAVMRLSEIFRRVIRHLIQMNGTARVGIESAVYVNNYLCCAAPDLEAVGIGIHSPIDRLTTGGEASSQAAERRGDISMPGGLAPEDRVRRPRAQHIPRVLFRHRRIRVSGLHATQASWPRTALHPVASRAA